MTYEAVFKVGEADCATAHYWLQKGEHKMSLAPPTYFTEMERRWWCAGWNSAFLRLPRRNR